MSPLRALLFLSALALCAAPLRAQSASLIDSCPSDPTDHLPALTYDVASFHKAIDTGRTSIQEPGRQATYTASGVSLKNLLENAFGIHDYQLSGAPGWLETQRYDIRASADEEASKKLESLTSCQARIVRRHMMQALLADRMKLTIQRSTREMSGYTLVIAKGGVKMQAAPADPPSDATAHTADTPSRKGSSMSMRSNGVAFDVNATAYTLDFVALWLSGQMHAPVEDKTGLKDKYDFTLHFATDEMRGASTEQSDLPTLTTAIQEQLGLKLEPAKVTVEIITIDHVEQPSEN